uniref:Protein kinase domain-containing protein n=1 Tax=Macrostomum lignano TaxID=282301 RepID=A0A1I8JS95_9PLAT
RWDAVRLIGRGGFGEVQEVRTDTGVTCAAKTLRLPVQLGDDQTSVSTEIHRAVESEKKPVPTAASQHRQILAHRSAEARHSRCIHEMLLDGRSLGRFIDNKPLDELTIRDFSEQICRALLYLHSRQPPVIHRDINCSNIIVCADNTRIKLIDFGLSVKLEQHSELLGSGAAGTGRVGQPRYSRESDIWAFGCSVFQMVSGRRPFAEHKMLHTLPERLRSSGAPALPTGCSVELQDFYSRCTAMDRKSRKSALELMGHEFLIVRKSWDSTRFVARGCFGDIQEVVTDRGIRCTAKTLRLPVQLGDDQISSCREREKPVRLRHPNIVRFLHIAQPEPATVVVFMELLDGRSLERFIDNNKPLDELTIRDFSEQICCTLLYLHSRQPPVIHRDINCSNIIVCADNTRIKLIDFGLSIKLEQSVSRHSAFPESLKGTLSFMAPELLGIGTSECEQYSRESDIWAFGCSVFQMASGTKPFSKEGAPALPEGRSAEFQDFYSRCTAKDRSERHSAEKLLEHEFLRKKSDSQH